MLSARPAARGAGKRTRLPQLQFILPVRHVVPVRQLSAVPDLVPGERAPPSSKPTRYMAHSPANRFCGRLRGRNSLVYPATTILAEMLKHRYYSCEDPAQWPNFPLHHLEWIATETKMRLPVLTAQLLLRFAAAEKPIFLGQYLESEEEWQRRLEHVNHRQGVTAQDIAQWLWILTADTTDLRVERLLRSAGCYKPVFLLHMVLGADQQYNKAETLSSMISYVQATFVKGTYQALPGVSLSRRPPQVLRRGSETTPFYFRSVLIRLVNHCLRSWPAALVPVAHLVASYIESIPLDSLGNSIRGGFSERCRIFNLGLELFSSHASVSPVKNMKYNWQAQKVLLALSARLKPHLIVNRIGYRSLRRVLIVLKKTHAERLVAERAAKTWPPYRQVWDGTDERRKPEDDISRSAKVGTLMLEAGYQPTAYDEMLTVLGGSNLGRPPTIASRSLTISHAQLVRFRRSRAPSGQHAVWAALVQATRNEREAWRAFEAPPQPHLKPDSQVYAQMFEKLYAPPVTNSPPTLPGGTKAVFPVHNGNLSPFEIARLTPPSPAELYDRMLQQGVKPVGECLAVLLRNAESLTAGVRYFKDSTYDTRLETLLKPVFVSQDSVNLSKIPSRVLNAWITLLCRTHTSPIHLALSPTSLGIEGTGIQEAIRVITFFQANLPERSSGLEPRNYKSPWYTILGALASPKVIFSRDGPADNLRETVLVFMDNFTRLVADKGLDLELFECLCLMARKSKRMAVFRPAPHPPRDPYRLDSISRKLVLHTQSRLLETGRQFFGPARLQNAGAADAQLWRPQGQVVNADTVFRYMQALGACGEADEMVRLVEWILDAWDDPFALDDGKASWDLGFHYVIRTLAYFAGMAEQLVEPDVTRALQERLEVMRAEKYCSWYWPEPADNEDVQTDLEIVKWWLTEPRGGEGDSEA
ncbi:hypothetical protein B0T22DRAFT_175053 [Podospora appendiculata]|uniref:Uncharacterized protein n=1 Tax=Podospora appendiculata TaxID=314037 RepID=A0AAE1CDP4_9PEZI|nr:hypothetical protein B0T22DRAFT_175053 [Podospora appendiculata]